MTSVFEAISTIMGELPAIGKSGKAAEAQGGYAYRGIEQITAALQPLLAKHGVIVVPQADLISVTKSPGMKTDNWTDTALRVAWCVYGPDGTFLNAQTIGIGRDNADKGANKAMSQATKYLYLELFCISDKKDETEAQDYAQHVADERPPAPKTAGMLLFDRLAGQTPETQAKLRNLKNDERFKTCKLTAAGFDANPEWLDAVVEVLDEAAAVTSRESMTENELDR